MYYSRTGNASKALAIIIAIVFVFTSASFMTTTVSHAAAKAPKSITIKVSDKTINVGDQTTVKVTKVSPAKASKAVNWKSSNEAVASVSTDGVITGLANGTVKITAVSQLNKKVKKTVSIKVKGDLDILVPWVMTAYYSSSKINNTPLDKKVDTLKYNAKSNGFQVVKKSEKNIVGNYVQLCDTDGNKKADLIQVVAYKDGKTYWDAEAAWVKGAGTKHAKAEPIDDETGFAMFSQKQRVPYGERLLSSFGITDYSGTADWSRDTVIGDANDSIYYENTGRDWYSQKSNDTLTMLTGYRTELQTTGYNCVMSSALTVLDWYGVRGDLNEMDLASLRGPEKAGRHRSGTSIDEDITMYRNLSKLGLTGEWTIETWNDDPEKLYDNVWIQNELKKGHPVGVIWNSFGPHGQVIIGYDNMGTPGTNDDVLIVMDPYDTTDQNPDGYIVQSYERLAYGKLTWGKEGTNNTKFISVYPKDGSWDKAYRPEMEEGTLTDPSNIASFSDANKMSYGNTANDIQKYYKKEIEIYDEKTGLSGAAGVERSGDSDKSAYYKHINFAQSEDAVKAEIGSKTLKLLDSFQTIQQSTEYTCGCDSALLTLNWFGKNAPRKGDGEEKYGEGQLETDISLCRIRQDGEMGATFRKGMLDIFDYMSKEYDQKWVTFSNLDLDEPYGEESYIGDYCLQAGAHSEGWPGLIPYLIDNDIPMMIGSDEWGGHWQVIVGYDGLGTEGTQDDVLILAEPYDTTDHNQDGYVIKGFERLVYGWGAAFEAGSDEWPNKWKVDGEEGANDFVVAIPDEPEYADVISELGLK